MADPQIDQWLDDGGPCPIGPDGPSVVVLATNDERLWDALITSIKEHTTRDVVVAGGCIRDYYLRVAPKDIDICVAAESKEELATLGDALNASGLFSVHLITPDMHVRGDGTVSDGEGVPDLIGVLDGEAFGYPVNIIARTHHQEGIAKLIEGFDFEVVRAAYRPHGELYVGNHFWDDIQSRTATLTETATPHVSRPRFDRFDKRHPGLLKFMDYQSDVGEEPMREFLGA